MIHIKEKVALAPFTTFEIGGAARYFVNVRAESKLREAIAWARERGVPFVVLSGGSNVLAPDEGFDGLVIHFVGNLYSVEGGAIDAWAGTNLLVLIRAMAASGFGGWEHLAGIPGTLGGAVRGNAGAFGSEVKDFVIWVRALNSETGDAQKFDNAACDFSYRHSYFKDNPEWIITRVRATFERADKTTIETGIAQTIAEREKRHLQNVRAAGSYFMNPIVPPEVIALFEKEKGVASRGGRVPAGWLIEKAGMKGAEVGGAIASMQHPNYLVNQSAATASDVLGLAKKVRAAVAEKFGVMLQEEAAVFHS